MLESAREMARKLRDVAKRYPDLVTKALRIEAEIEATEVKKRTPVYTGPTGPGKPIPGLLRGSVHVRGPFREGRRIYAIIVAGGAAGAYAWPQHEHLDWYHEIGQAKYIESVIMESRQYMGARIARRVQLAKLRST